MKQAINALSLAVLLARANAQGTTGVVTSYFSVCPTATTTTITLQTTTTICPGPQCAGTTTTPYVPNPMTTVGADGKTTVYEQLTYTAPCPCDGGICDAVYTITRACPCTAPHPATVIPAGFTTAAVACQACAQNGGPSTVTVITPAPNGPYATQTPVLGAPYNGAYASAGAYAYASAGPNGAVAGAGANAVASAGSGSAAAGAGADSDSDSDSDSDANANASASASASAWAQNGTAGASSSSSSSADTDAGNNGDSGSSSGSNSTGIYPPITPYHGSADRTAQAASAILAGVLGFMAFLL